VSELEDLRDRMSALESMVRREAELRAAVDQDQSDMAGQVRAMHHLVQALSITQSEHGEKLTRMTNWARRHDGRLNRIEEMLEQLLRRGEGA
jgi:hypothetical protein